MTIDTAVGIEHARHPSSYRVLTPGALAFLAELDRRFRVRRAELLEWRAARQARVDAGELPDFLPDTLVVRQAPWLVARAPAALVDRRVEITGPAERRAMITALGCGAQVFVADLEDATAPTWDNVVTGQVNLQDAARQTLRLITPERTYRLPAHTATLLVRPRGLHLDEPHVRVDGRPIAASLFDFCCYVFHNAEATLARGAGPYCSLPKLESHLEARWWQDVFAFAEDELDLGRGAIRATVSIETLPAAFEMEEILFELRDHVCALSAGRRDYLFSLAKTLHAHDAFVLPDQDKVSATTPFVHAYNELLVATCHRRGAHAIGEAAALVPDRSRPEASAHAIAVVAADSAREAAEGFDGTSVVHPDLVGAARAAFDAALADRPDRLEPHKARPVARAADLLAVSCPPGGVTFAGLRANVSVAIGYLAAWLAGTGTVVIEDLRADAASAEIARAEVWQWVRHRVALEDGTRIDAALVANLCDLELAERVAEQPSAAQRFGAARALFEQVALGETFVAFFTLPAGGLLG